MLYQVTHTTRYSYELPASQSLNEVRLTPRSLAEQQVLETKIEVEPGPAALQHRKDYFGNQVTTFAILEPHRRLQATANSVVEVQPFQPDAWRPLSSLAWEDARDLIAEPHDDTALAAFEFVFDSPFVPPNLDLAEYARPTFTPGRPFIDAVQELSHRIYTDFEYQPKSTTIDMPLIEVLHNRRGVCQDFAHVMIGVLRSLRLAARYVSGYVRTGAQYQGGGASHAWVSIFVPGRGWLSFDPTNDLIPSDGHVTLAWGRDYGDVTPVKGITLGGGGQTIEVDVRLQPAGSSNHE